MYIVCTMCKVGVRRHPPPPFFLFPFLVNNTRPRQLAPGSILIRTCICKAYRSHTSVSSRQHYPPLHHHTPAHRVFLFPVIFFFFFFLFFSFPTLIRTCTPVSTLIETIYYQPPQPPFNTGINTKDIPTSLPQSLKPTNASYAISLLRNFPFKQSQSIFWCYGAKTSWGSKDS